jgi:hypothetical protein
VPAVADAVLTLRCHSCSHGVGTSTTALHIVALFKPAAAGRLAQAHTGEVRRRCQACGWVNVFHPEPVRARIEVK